MPTDNIARRHPMKKLITLAALTTAINSTFAEMVSVSNILATTKFEAIDRRKKDDGCRASD
jgi:hypothetical protein